MGFCARPFNLTGYPDGNIVLCRSWWDYLTPLDGLLLLVILIWGSNFSLVKTAIEEVPTFGFNTVRMATACLVLLTVSRLNGEAAPDRGDWPRLITLGFFGHCWYRLAFVTGLERTTVANSSLILGCMPIAVMVLNALSGRLEGCGNCQRFGVGFAIAGVYLVAGEGAGATAETDVSRARRQPAANEAAAGNLRNSTLPALDLVGTIQLTGQGGLRLIPAGNSLEDILGGAGGVIPGGYGDALHSIANADYPVWRVQLQMTCPLGRSADRAAYERARLELQHNRVQIRRIELRIASEVINAALRIESIRERIEAATGGAGTGRGTAPGRGEQVRGGPVDQLLRPADR